MSKMTAQMMMGAGLGSVGKENDDSTDDLCNKWKESCRETITRCWLALNLNFSGGC